MTRSASAQATRVSPCAPEVRKLGPQPVLARDWPAGPQPPASFLSPCLAGSVLAQLPELAGRAEGEAGEDREPAAHTQSPCEISPDPFPWGWQPGERKRVNFEFRGTGFESHLCTLGWSHEALGTRLSPL